MHFATVFVRDEDHVTLPDNIRSRNAQLLRQEDSRFDCLIVVQKDPLALIGSRGRVDKIKMVPRHFHQ